MKQYRETILVGGPGRFLAFLLAQTPSLTVALKAGLKVQVRARVWRHREQRWEELGTVSDSNHSIRRYLAGLLTLPKLSFRLTVGGIEVERANY